MFDLCRLAAAGLVAHIDHHDSIGSTSDRALALAAEGLLPLPLLVLADRQTAGRGRSGKRWQSSPGALTFSLVLASPADRLPLERWPLVALVAGVAVCEALRELAPSADLRLKWPNDILLGGRKLCGILSESVPGWRDRLVVGIGVNVNNSVSQIEPLPSSPPLPIPAIALFEHDRVSRALTIVLLEILDRLESRWQQFLMGHVDDLLAAYRQRCFLTGKTVTLEQPGGQRVLGICHGLDARGQLLLRTPLGLREFVSGTVVAWEP